VVVVDARDGAADGETAPDLLLLVLPQDAV